MRKPRDGQKEEDRRRKRKSGKVCSYVCTVFISMCVCIFIYKPRVSGECMCVCVFVFLRVEEMKMASPQENGGQSSDNTITIDDNRLIFLGKNTVNFPENANAKTTLFTRDYADRGERKRKKADDFLESKPIKRNK